MARIPGCENVEADKESRTFRRCTEWCLKNTLFSNACAKLIVTPNIDLFASRINYQITPFVSYVMQHHLLYTFPPFSLITRVLQKIQEDKTTGLLLNCAEMANPTVVAQVNADINSTTNATSKEQRYSVSTHSMSLVRRCLNGNGLSTKS